jgi:hypothetical protein
MVNLLAYGGVGLEIGGERWGVGTVGSKSRDLGSDRGYRVADEERIYVEITVVVVVWVACHLTPTLKIRGWGTRMATSAAVILWEGCR